MGHSHLSRADAAGNVATQTVTVTNIDKVARQSSPLIPLTIPLIVNHCRGRNRFNQ
jgi:hypothetical protein